MDINMLPIPSGDNLEKNRKERKRRAKKKDVENNERENKVIVNDNLEASENGKDNAETNNVSKENIPEKDSSVAVVDEHLGMHTGSTENIANGNVDRKGKKKRKKEKLENFEDVGQSMEQNGGGMVELLPLAEESKMDTNVDRKGKKKRKKKEKLENFKDVGQSMEQNGGDMVELLPLAEESKMDTDSTQGNLTSKKKIKSKRKEKAAKIEDEVQNMDQTTATDVSVVALDEHCNMNSGSMENLADENVSSKKRKKKRKSIEKLENIEDVVQNMEQTCDMVKLLPLSKQSEMDEDSMQENVTKKGRRKSKRKEKEPEINDDVQNIDQTIVTDSSFSANEHCEMNTGSMENIADKNFARKRKKKRKSVEKMEKIEDDVQNIDQTIITDSSFPEDDHCKMNTGSMENTDENVAKKRKKKRKVIEKMEKIEDDVQNIDQTIITDSSFPPDEHCRMNTGSTENIADENVAGKRKKKRKNIEKIENIEDVVQSTEQTSGVVKLPLFAEQSERDKDSTQGDVTNKRKRKSKKDEINSIDQTNASQMLLPPEVEKGSTVNLAESNVAKRIRKTGKKTKKATKIEDEVQIREQTGVVVNLQSENENRGLGIDEYAIITQESESCATDNKKSANVFNKVDNGVIVHPIIAPKTSIRRKLLVLDLNGLLADIIYPGPNDCKGDIKICGRAVFRRPLYYSFLDFCFHYFDVAIWSSRAKPLVDKIVDYLFGNLKHKLLFWGSKDLITTTTWKTVENKHKNIVFKELRKIWERNDREMPWKKGDYNESNTLLLDDSPYKALLNPAHTAIFPHSFKYTDENDTSLGPGGDLRLYLEGLLSYESVQKYVEQNPFGQCAIDETHLDWGYYSKVIKSIGRRPPFGK